MSNAINKSAKVRMMLRRDPNAKAASVTELLGCSMQQAHVLLNTQRKQLGIIKSRDGIGTYKHKPRMESKERMESNEPALAGLLNKVSDPVNQPSHYKVGGIETIDFIEGKNLGYNLGNVVKYISRADHKDNKLQDLQKAQWYLNREIAKAQA